jgi:hypothetical protein
MKYHRRPGSMIRYKYLYLTIALMEPPTAFKSIAPLRFDFHYREVGGAVKWILSLIVYISMESTVYIFISKKLSIGGSGNGAII